MRQRCESPGHSGYRKYGARGISVCERWTKFENFLTDMGHAPAGETIDRLDNSRGYEPGNCRWATHKVQNNNRAYCRLLTHAGKTQTIQQWADELGVTHSLLHNRLSDGWPIEKVLTAGRYSRWGPRF